MTDLGALTFLFGQSFLVALSGALMPGPLLTVTISESAKQGFRAGPLVIIGHAISELIIIGIAAAGMGIFLKQEAVSGAICLVGGLVLIVMGVMMARGAKAAAQQALSSLSQQTDPDASDTAKPGNPYRCIYLGFLISVSSPYWILWWLTPGLAQLTKSFPYKAAGVSSFYLGHISADLIWYCIVAIAISRGVHWLNRRGYQTMILACGLILIGLGLRFGIDGIRKIFG